MSTRKRYVGTNGYALVRLGPNDWRYEHRVVWEEAHGPIPDGYHVHHVNHDRADNRLANLQLIRGVEHNRHHTAERHASGALNNRGSASTRYRVGLDDHEIVRRRRAGESFRSIGRDLGAAHNVIANHFRRAIEESRA